MIDSHPPPEPGRSTAVDACELRGSNKIGTCYKVNVAELLRVVAMLRTSPNFANDPGLATAADRLKSKAAAFLSDGLPSPCDQCLQPPIPPDQVTGILDAMEATALVKLEPARDDDGRTRVQRFDPGPDPDQ